MWLLETVKEVLIDSLIKPTYLGAAPQCIAPVWLRHLTVLLSFS